MKGYENIYVHFNPFRDTVKLNEAALEESGINALRPSVCSEACKTGQYPITRVGEPKSCFHCKNCTLLRQVSSIPAHYKYNHDSIGFICLYFPVQTTRGAAGIGRNELYDMPQPSAT